ncbi:MAG TPA: hypothetical protein VGM59_12445, partial [Dongiaceae bacterium]
MGKRRLLVIGIVLLGCIGIGGGTPWAFSEIKEAQIETALQGGGYVVYLRHADRNAGSREKLGAQSSLADFSHCETQRNLTTAGRNEAAEIGRSLQSFSIPVGTVIALPLCRTRDTAMLAFGHAALDPRLYDPDFVAKLLATIPSAGTNTVLVDTEDQ